MIRNYGLVLTHNRPELLAECVTALDAQVELIVVHDHNSDPPAVPPILTAPHLVIRETDPHPNLSRFWNVCFDAIAALVAQDGLAQWNVVVLCEDAIVPPVWVATTSTAMRRAGAAAACTRPVATPLLKTEPDADLGTRMTGWAYVLAGELGLRADERLEWWWGDTHMDWLARKAGGMLVVPGPEVPNRLPNDYLVRRQELGEQAGRDGETFREIWGWRPW